MIGKNKIYQTIDSVLDRMRERDRVKKKEESLANVRKGPKKISISVEDSEYEIIKRMARRYDKEPEEIVAELVKYQLKNN